MRRPSSARSISEGPERPSTLRVAAATCAGRRLARAARRTNTPAAKADGAGAVPAPDPPPRSSASAASGETPGSLAATSTESERFRYSRRRKRTRKGGERRGTRPASPATLRKARSRKEPTVDQVRGVTGSGSTSPTLARVRRARGARRASGTSSGSTVMGRLCRSTGPSDPRAHSTSRGAPASSSTRKARSQTDASSAAVRHPASGPSTSVRVGRSTT